MGFGLEQRFSGLEAGAVEMIESPRNAGKGSSFQRKRKAERAGSQSHSQLFSEHRGCVETPRVKSASDTEPALILL